jgi:hypothetical protein
MISLETSMPVATTNTLSFAVAILIGLSLAGCSPGDVQLNGKLFDAIGSATGVSGPTGDVKIAPRSGLVVPPSLQALPAPGSQAVPDGQLADIVDHDRKKVVDKSVLQAKQAEYCKVNYEQAKQRGDNVTADLAVGPLGSCRPSAMGLIDTINGKAQ